MSERDTVADIAQELATAIQPVSDALASQDAFVAFMWELGWDFATAPAPLQSLAAPAQTLADLVSGDEIDIASVPAVINGIESFVRGLREVNTIADAMLPPTIDKALFKAEFPRQLIDTLIVDYLFARHRPWATLLQAAGLIRRERVPAANQRPAHVERSIDIEALPTLVGDPLALIKARYNWGQSDFLAESLTHNLRSLLEAWGMRSETRKAAGAMEDSLRQGALPAQTRDVHRFMMRMPFVTTAIGSSDLAAGFELFMLPETATDKPGFALLPYAGGPLALEINLPDAVTIFMEGDVDFTAGVGILVRPDRPVRLLTDIVLSAAAGVAPPGAAQVAFGVRVGGESAPVILAGAPDASRLEVSTVSVKGGAGVQTDGEHDVFVEAEWTGARIVIVRGPDCDGFIEQLLPAEPVTVEFGFGAGLSARHGLYFTDGSSLEIQFPTHIQLGPIEIVSALIALKPDAGTMPVDVAVTIKGDLGPLQAVVENIGLRVTLGFPANRAGNLGPIDVSLGLRPPNGVGLSIDAGVVKGGGYLFIDADRGEYAGALELTFSDFLSLKAIGLIATRMPDGSKGFSLLIIITAEFNPGLQLGYGFSLIGVGGLLGLHRTVILEALALGVRTGAVNGILFPVDPVANAPRIISDLRTIFPVYVGRFLIGPMAKLGWGTPTLVSLSLGLIIEIPGNVAILGILKLALPVEDAPVLQLQVNFIGAIEFDKKRGWFFAALYESRLLFITLEGEMGMLIAVGADANFLISAGGFHPRFSPPPLPFPSPRRIAFDIVNTSSARIRADAYFAVTTNTAQFGARAEVYFGFDSASVEGHLAFDALLRFSPLSFIVEIGARASLKALGVGVFTVDLAFTLEGPTPWRARGRGSASLLGVDVSADFDVTWGDSRSTALPAILVVPLLQGEFDKAANWRALPPPSSHLLVSLRTLDLPGDALVMHPLGTLEVSQNAVPLGFTLDKIGAQKPADANRFAVNVKSGSGLAKRRDARRGFAPAQFRNFNDAQKLSAPAFQNEVSGIELGVEGAELRTGRAVKRSLRYEVTTLDTAYRRFVRRFQALESGLFGYLLKGGAVGKSALSRARRTQLQPFDDRVELAADRYAVVFTANNRAAAPGSATFATEQAARDWLSAAAANDPKGLRLHVVPATEVSEAA